MNASSEDVKSMLNADALVDTTNYPINIGVEPASPINCITLTDYAAAPELNMDRTEDYEHPSLQIRVRSIGYTEGMNVMESIKKSLHGRANEPWNGAFYALIRCKNSMYMGQDENQRMHFVINIGMQRYQC